MYIYVYIYIYIYPQQIKKFLACINQIYSHTAPVCLNGSAHFRHCFPLFWILLPAAAICACLHDGHALAPGSRQPCAGPGWLHFSVHCAEHHPWQMVSAQPHIHTYTSFTRECVLFCVYTWLSFKWVSVWCLLIMNSMMLRHVQGTTQGCMHADSKLLTGVRARNRAWMPQAEWTGAGCSKDWEDCWSWGLWDTDVVCDMVFVREGCA